MPVSHPPSGRVEQPSGCEGWVSASRNARSFVWIRKLDASGRSGFPVTNAERGLLAGLLGAAASWVAEGRVCFTLLLCSHTPAVVDPMAPQVTAAAPADSYVGGRPCGLPWNQPLRPAVGGLTLVLTGRVAVLRVGQSGSGCVFSSALRADEIEGTCHHGGTRRTGCHDC